ncbi:MAG: hypothetical protein IJP03_06880 [Christensenellaceae bacterium]|nr:hypothetical protein [Christensenellaceae bacterium]
MSERFTLEFPAKAQYMLPLRLYISGLAARMDFSVDSVEDIKTAVSEACTLLLCFGGDRLQAEIVAETGKMDLCICVTGEATKKADAEGEEAAIFGEMIMQAMAQSCQVQKDENGRTTRVELGFSEQ